MSGEYKGQVVNGTPFLQMHFLIVRLNTQRSSRFALSIDVDNIFADGTALLFYSLEREVVKFFGIGFKVYRCPWRQYLLIKCQKTGVG